MQQYLSVLLTQAQLVLQEAVAPPLHRLRALRGADQQMQVVREGVEEGFGCQAAETALQVKEVGGTTADESAMVCDVGKQLSAVRRTAKGLLIGVKDGDVAAVAGQ